MDTTLSWLTLHLVPGLGATGCHRLIEYFGDPATILRASRKELERVPNIRKASIASLVQNTNTSQRLAEKELHRADRFGVSIIPWNDKRYPELLKNIYNPPVVLYVRGDFGIIHTLGIAIVGSRAATTYGLKIARQLAGDLARAGVSVVSGLALGIDTAAHQGALDVEGKTVAVMGCGLDICYPQRNDKLAEQIAQNGALVSEYPFGTKPEAFRFPARNRIINGLANGVVVVEAATRSGSLITASLALDEGREVFAVPGRVDSYKSAGTHKLLQQGAKLVYKADDILEELPVATRKTGCVRDVERTLEKEKCETGEESSILSVMDDYPQHIDDIILKSGLPTQTVTQVLLLLELNGRVESSSGQQYRLAENVD